MIDALDRLSNVPAGLQASDIGSAFGVELIHAEQRETGIKYSNDATADGIHLEVFAMPNGEFRLAITNLSDQPIDHWRERLTEKGWEAEVPILHPFLMDSFRKDGKQIRLEHDSTSVSSVAVFGLNARSGE